MKTVLFYFSFIFTIGQGYSQDADNAQLPVNSSQANHRQSPTFAIASNQNNKRSHYNENSVNCTDCAVAFNMLPVSIVAWNVSKSTTGAKVQWISAHESEGVNYTLQKSTDGIHFKDIHSKKCSYKSGNRNHYSYTDGTIINGLTWYRLKLKSAAAGTSYSKVIVINTGDKTFDVITLDNPFRDSIRTEISVVEEADILLTVTHADGKLIYTNKIVALKGSTVFTIENLHHLPIGEYYLAAQKGTERKVQRILKY